MNRRELFGWLSALPFVPAALAKGLTPITFPAPTANWGKIVEFTAFDEVSGGGYARVSMSSSLASWAGSMEGQLISEEASARWGWPWPLDPYYQPNLPEWF